MKKPWNTMVIPFESYRWIGGPATFMHNLQRYLDQQHLSYMSSVKAASHAKVLFFPNSLHLEKVKKVKERGGYVLQRLDGVHYLSKHGEHYADLNKDVKEIYLHYADLVVFQSRYSRAQCFAMLGERKEYTIIINGADKSIFYPSQIRKDTIINEKIRFITTGRFRNIDMLEPMVQALDTLKDSFDFELVVIGPIVNAKLEPFLRRTYLTHIEALTLPEIAEELRRSDIFVYSHLNPPCPNAVIEAISCGVPVVGFDSGAMSELCFFSEELLAPVSNEVFQRYEDFDANKLADKILLAVQHYEHYRDTALAHSHLYSFEECGQQYLDVFQSYAKKRRTFIPYMKYLFKHAMKKIQRLPSHLKGRLLKRFVLPPDSFIQHLLLKLSEQQLRSVIFSVIAQKSRSLPPSDSLKFLFDLENNLYSLEGEESVRYGNGLHTKHKHINYHDFFVHRIDPESYVLDVGCGNGALTHDIATQVEKVFVYGIDINPKNIETAQHTYSAANTKFICGDALRELPDQAFNVIILSNVLEHIEKRVDFLRELQQKYQPQKFLLRVPVFERDWRVPLKKELGIDYRLDPTHYIEYRQEEFFQEIAEAGLHLHHIQINWGEIWAEII